jgi:hypothetical protein
MLRHRHRHRLIIGGIFWFGRYWTEHDFWEEYSLLPNDGGFIIALGWMGLMLD